MYTDRDYEEIDGLLGRAWRALILTLAALLAVYVFALAKGVQWLAYASGAGLVIAGLYISLAKVLPRWRYRRFLLDIREGGSHVFAGVVTSVSTAAEPQDGAMVLPVHVRLDAPEEERTYYLNTAKAEHFPGVGAHVCMRCFGRHIIELMEPEEAKG